MSDIGTEADSPDQTGDKAAPRSDLIDLIGNRLKQSDILLATLVVGVLVVLILPMPSWLLDFSLAISITFSVMILMTCLFIQVPLEFNSFPTVLLLATMLRLALNMASTRLILSKGHEGPQAAGQVIEAFGNFVMSGNFVIGIIVFAILIIVNFVVITKGSGRIAEVAARFTLDAMPGKQMAIDADLSAGLISEDEARQRRQRLEDESTFYGAMDGAAKFVRGDAVAGLLITFINVVGGIIVGVAQNDLSFTEASETYTLLTVGDGLVSQIPALIVSTAAGLLVSKAGIDGPTDKAILNQVGGYPRAVALSSAMTLALSLLPGIPMIPFLVLSLGLGYLAWQISSRHRAEEVAEQEESERAQEAVEPTEEPISTALLIDELRLEIGYGLLPLINDGRGYRLTDQIKALRRQIASDMGFVMPSVRILDNMQLASNQYCFRIKEVEAGRGEVRTDKLLVMDPRGGEITLAGEATTEPAFGLPAMWIDETMREEAAFHGFTVVDPATVITTHLTETLKENMAELVSYAATQKLLDELPAEHQKLIDDLIPTQITVASLQRILQRLLAERISIRDLPTILEGIAEATGYTQNIVTIAEHVRSRLARQISQAHAAPAGFVPLVTLSPDWEQKFAEAITGQDEMQQLAMAPSHLQEFIARVRQVLDDLATKGETPVVLTSPSVRPYVRSIIERFRPTTTVLSQNEIHPKAKIRTLAQI